MSLLEQLQRDGLVPVGSMPVPHVDAIVAHLSQHQRYACHVERDRKPYAGGEVACWGMDALLTAPHFFEFALSFADLAGAYLEQTPHMYSVNVFETYPSNSRLNPDIQEFHHDKDDVKFLALFIYLTDVNNPSDGSHQYQLGTHRSKDSLGTVDVCGPRGTAFLSDGRGQHRGLRPVDKARTIAWARWGVSNPPASYLWDKMKPVSKTLLGDRYPTDPTVQDSIRLVVA